MYQLKCLIQAMALCLSNYMIEALKGAFLIKHKDSVKQPIYLESNEIPFHCKLYNQNKKEKRCEESRILNIKKENDFRGNN